MTEHLQGKPNARERRYHRFFQVVEAVVAEIQAHQWADTGQTLRQLRGNDLQKLEASVEVLIRDSVALVHQRKRKGEASIHLNGSWYSSSASPDKLTYSVHVQRAYRGMLELGYLEQTRNGVFDRQGRKDGSTRSRLTRYRATDRLIERFTREEQQVLPAIVPPQLPHLPIRIRLKHEDGRQEILLAPDSDEVGRMRQHLDRINGVLARNWFDLDIPDAELAELQARLAEDPEGAKPLALDRRTLHRVFNDEDLTTGGRFYGGWWQNVPKAYRRHLLVNGKRMVEIDYSNFHPVILYAEEGVVPPDDCYRGIFDGETEARHGTALRSTVKAAFNAMLNAGKPLRQSPRGIEPGRFGMSWREFSEAIIVAHEPIARHFYSGVGKRLQRTDSDVAEQVMLDLAENGIPILPIHDSFLVHEGHRDLLHERMRAALVAVCNVDAQLKATDPDLSRILAARAREQALDPDGFGPSTTSDVGEIEAGMEGHDRRLDAFLAQRKA
ncbi:hypothetical protein [Limimaricola litoreus]|uniref:Uncharacterized protein n=1 Tax=Limimaricola litoreus TaxID=2955316 RepID=A0A9X2FPM2_9RHOB|nr:hypothetical protein [Limimaricola litoreus]MCP1169219.1 hypothetical protein [Limimaricola litoreus]